MRWLADKWPQCTAVAPVECKMCRDRPLRSLLPGFLNAAITVRNQLPHSTRARSQLCYSDPAKPCKARTVTEHRYWHFHTHHPPGCLLPAMCYLTHQSAIHPAGRAFRSRPSSFTPSSLSAHLSFLSHYVYALTFDPDRAQRNFVAARVTRCPNFAAPHVPPLLAPQHRTPLTSTLLILTCIPLTATPPDKHQYCI